MRTITVRLLHALLVLAIVAFALVPAFPAGAVGGDLVTYYGNGGRTSDLMHFGGKGDATVIKVDSSGNYYFGRTFSWTLEQTSTQVSSSYVGVTKLNSSGTPVAAFGTSGTVKLIVGTDPNVGLADMLIQPDGRILIAGETTTYGANDPLKCWVARLNADGSPDATFGANGQFELSSPNGGFCMQPRLARAASGQILVGFGGQGLSNDNANVVRLNSNGTLDATFGVGGYASPKEELMNFSGIAVNASGEILTISQSSFPLSGGRYSSTWNVHKFSAAGAIIGKFFGSDYFAQIGFFGDPQPAYPAGIAIQTDGRIVVTGAASNGFDYDFHVLRMTSAGELDTTYSGDGKIMIPMNTNDYPRDMWLDAANNLMLAGYSEGQTAIARVTSNGVLDASFGSGGKLLFGPLSETFAVDASGRILAAYSQSVRRYLASGAVDTTFGAGGLTTLPGISTAATIQALARQSSGRIIASGYSTDAFDRQAVLVSYNVNQALNTSFGDSKTKVLLGFKDAPALAVFPDNRIVVAGTRAESGTGRLVWGVSRFHEFGNIDTAFGGTPSVGTTSIALGSGDAHPAAMALQPDGKIVITGYALSGSKPVVATVRLNADGSPDTTFDGDGIALTDFASSTGAFGTHVAIQSDGKIVVAGNATIAGFDQVAAVRYNTNGTLDTTFDGDGKILTAFPGSEFVRARGIVQTSDSRTVIAAAVDYPGSASEFTLAKYLVSGALDPAFGTAGISRHSFYGDSAYTKAMVMLPTGKFLLAGEASTIDGNNNLIGLFRADGSLDPGVGAGGFWSATDPAGTINLVEALLLLPDGKVITGGTTFTAGQGQYATVEHFGDGGTIAFPSATITVTESAGAVSFIVTRSEGSSGYLQANYTIASGTATVAQNCCGGGIDAHGSLSGIVAWGDGWTGSASIPLTIYSDALVEPDETFTITLSGPGVVSPSVLTVTIAGTADTMPNPFTFNNVSGVAPSSTQTSNSVTISGINIAVPISVSGGTYSIGCTATFTGVTGTISNGQTVCVRHTSSAAASGTVTTTLTIGGVNGTFSSTVAATQLLSVSKLGAGGGTLTTNPAAINCGATCSASFATASNVTVIAVPGAGSAFSSWSGDCSGSGTCAVTMNGARNVVATFIPVTQTLTVTKAGTGSGNVLSAPAGIDCGAGCSASFGLGTQVTLTPTPTINSQFTGWSGACTGTGACVVTMDAAKSVNAAFTLVTNAVSTTTMAFNPLTVTCGANAPWAATVSGSYGTPTGNVTLKTSGGIVLGNYGLTSGVAGSFMSFAGFIGTANYYVTYNGNGTYATSQSALAPITVTKATPGVALVSGNNPAAAGSSVTLTATVSSAGVCVTPDGSVTFKDGATTLGTVALNAGGIATLTTSSFTSGAHSLTAEYSGGSFYVPATSNTVNQVVDAFLTPPNDFNDDGKSDLLWKNTADGSTQGWLMNGLAATQIAGLLPAGGYSVTHVADLDGDGKADLLIRHTDGTVIGWLMNGLSVPGNAVLLPAGSGWSVIKAADLNGDGKADLIVQHTDGTVVAWIMNGLSVASTSTFVPAGSGWSVAKVADLNGDGKADLIWQHTDGTVQAWLMDGTIASQVATFVGAGSGWSVARTGDFDGDGKTDLLWQHSDGRTQAWIMNGLTVTGLATFTPAGTGWTPVHAGDIDGDGKDDLFWEHTSGASQTWLMNGTSVTTLATFVPAGTGWTASHLFDLNGDGKMDVLWKHTNGAVQAWLMNGLTITQLASLAPAGTYLVTPPAP